ncbi:alginate lyase family protein [Roseibium sediminicola]|uniref:Alginate lyase family protein n=1 Tax=Roseibium sediminicola TaxID=2933272 RepID=A0ABT0GXV0_9HYPH|nr:alginate lyase family protein [Roseibium sp. CAU 1639]MCK7614156.1 alginate lyase family protein [Roseibium sp. CAU 1639]
MSRIDLLKSRLAGCCVAAAAALPLLVSAEAAHAFTCPEFPAPTVSLEFGSRYKDDSKTRSEKDVRSDAEVTAALKPSDDFVRQLTEVSNMALEDPELTEAATHCVVEGVRAWAEADAFSDMRTITAKISYPARVGGIAVAYRQVRPFADAMADDRQLIESWLRVRADEIVEFWDTDAPTKAKQANLRAWAALAITQIGLILDEPAYLDWGLLSQRIILDTEDPDGSLPLEMRRGKWGLHYQLHAMAPMSVTTALLCQAGYRNSPYYETLLEKAVRFSLKGIEDPGIVEAINGKKQTVEPGLDNQKTFVLAWLEAYLNFNYDPGLDERLATFRPLNNSKLGGNLTLLFRDNLDRPLGCRERDNS